MFRLLRTLQLVSRRTVSSSAPRQLENKVPGKQKMFQEDNGVPVHLKGGVVDALLYRATMTLTVFGKMETCVICIIPLVLELLLLLVRYGCQSHADEAEREVYSGFSSFLPDKMEENECQMFDQSLSCSENNMHCINSTD